MRIDTLRRRSSRAPHTGEIRVARLTVNETMAALASPALFVPKRGKHDSDVLASLSDYRVTRTWIDGLEVLLESTR